MRFLDLGAVGVAHFQVQGGAPEPEEELVAFLFGD